MKGETSDDGFEGDMEASENRGARRKESSVSKVTAKLTPSKLFDVGRRVADCIEDSYHKIKTFDTSYDEWLQIRKNRIKLLMDKEEKIRNFYSYCLVNEIRSTVATGSDLSTIFANVICSLVKSRQDQSVREDDMQRLYCHIVWYYKKDHDLIQIVYNHGLQCSTQFEETRQQIEKFRDLIKEQDDLETIIEDGHVLEFLKEISYLDPVDSNFFYRRLSLCFETLLKNSDGGENCKSDESKYFIRILGWVPKAVEVINLLPWKFDTAGIDVSSVGAAQNKLLEYLQNSAKIDAHTGSKILFDCIKKLEIELGFLESIRNDLKFLRRN